MKDWADEIVKELNVVCGGIAEQCDIQIAVALRKAKADGFQEASMLMLKASLEELP